MKANELIHLLQQYPNREVIVRVGDGLYCPVEGVKTFSDSIVVRAKDVRTSVIDSPFELPKYEPSVKTVYIIDNKK